MQVTATNTKIVSPEQPLMFRVVFRPQHMFSTDIEFVVHKSTGGRWRFDMHLQVIIILSGWRLLLGLESACIVLIWHASAASLSIITFSKWIRCLPPQLAHRPPPLPLHRPLSRTLMG